jgi:hypothetical protein
MKKSTLISVMLALLIITPVFADDDSNVSEKMTYFKGGSFNINFGFDTDSIYGARGDAARMGGSQSTLDFNPSFTSYNPACLAFLKTSVASMDLVPGPLLSSRMAEKFMSKDMGTTIRDSINDNMDDAFKDYNSSGIVTRLDSVGVTVEQQSGFTGFEIMVPFANNQASIAFARENKFSMDASIIQNGFNTILEIGNKSNSSVSVTMTAAVDSTAQVQLNNIVTSVGIGRQFTPEWGVGAVVEHYDSNIIGDAKVNITGTARNSNSGDMGIGDLSQYGYGNLYGEAWGLRFGTSYHFLSDALELGADFSIQPEIQYKGSANAIYHIISQNIAPTDTNVYTEERTVEESGTLKMKLPSFMRLTFAFKAGMVVSLNYTHYFDSLAMKYNLTQIYSDASGTSYSNNSGEVGLDMMDDLRLGLNFGVFQIGGGAIYSRAYSTKDGKTTQSYFAIPVLSTGFTIPFGDHLKWEVELLASTLPVGKTAITYNF